MEGVTDRRGEVLVAILNNRDDLAIAQEAHWYRIPVRSQQRYLKDRWPPRWLAFYQTKVFEHEAYQINYYGRVREIRQVSRQTLFPDTPSDHPKATRQYYQVVLEPLQRLPKPIIARRQRRILFIPTTWGKFANALEINDLWDESPLEDKLWAMFKRANIPAERQLPVAVGDSSYRLDFALFCELGQIDVETDGDSWHHDREEKAGDDLRDDDLAAAGWSVLRFNTEQIREQAAEYCLPTVQRAIQRLGGLEDSASVLG